MELKERNITEKRRKAWFIVWAVAFVLLLAGGLYYYLFFYVNREKVQKAWVDVKVVTYYELMQDGIESMVGQMLEVTPLSDMIESIANMNK